MGDDGGGAEAIMAQIPVALQDLKTNGTNLQELALYCAASSTNKAPEEALKETRQYALSALSSVAYQINQAAQGVSQFLEIQTQQVEMESYRLASIGQAVGSYQTQVGDSSYNSIAIDDSEKRREHIVKKPELLQKYRQPFENLESRRVVDFNGLDKIGCGAAQKQHEDAKTEDAAPPNNKRVSTVTLHKLHSSHNTLKLTGTKTMFAAKGANTQTMRAPVAPVVPGGAGAPRPPVAPTVPLSQGTLHSNAAASPLRQGTTSPTPAPPQGGSPPPPPPPSYGNSPPPPPPLPQGADMPPPQLAHEGAVPVPPPPPMEVGNIPPPPPPQASFEGGAAPKEGAADLGAGDVAGLASVTMPPPPKKGAAPTDAAAKSTLAMHRAMSMSGKVDPKASKASRPVSGAGVVATPPSLPTSSAPQRSGSRRDVRANSTGRLSRDSVLVPEAAPAPPPADPCNATVMYDYKSAAEDEIDLRQGERVEIIFKNEDGWYQGRRFKENNFDDFVEGLFPGGFVTDD